MLFKDPIIAICSICAYVLGMGMFGVIIYLPLFMQGVLGVSATQSGNLLTPLMMGAVVGSIVGGQTVSRTGTYKRVALVGSVLVAIGMIVFAQLGLDTARMTVVYGMVISGLGMGLLQPVYTLAVRTSHRGGGRWARPPRPPSSSIDRQHRRRRRLRLDHAHAVRRVRGSDAGARAAGGTAVASRDPLLLVQVRADGSGVRAQDRRCCDAVRQASVPRLPAACT